MGSLLPALDLPPNLDSPLKRFSPVLQPAHADSLQKQSLIPDFDQLFKIAQKRCTLFSDLRVKNGPFSTATYFFQDYIAKIIRVLIHLVPLGQRAADCKIAPVPPWYGCQIRTLPKRPSLQAGPQGSRLLALPGSKHGCTSSSC